MGHLDVPFVIDCSRTWRKAVRRVYLVDKGKHRLRTKKGLKMAELKYEVVERLGVLSEDAKGWKKELNLVSWNEREAKYDLRSWNADHTRMSKGITLTKEEVEILASLLQEEVDHD